MIWRRRFRRSTLLLIFAVFALIWAHNFSVRLLGSPAAHRAYQPSWRNTNHAKRLGKGDSEEKELVVASFEGADTRWLDMHFDTWKKNVYVVDNASAPLTVSVNKGREAMPFLTYIVDRYDSLPDVSIFIQSPRYQWHNEDPMYDGLPVLRRLRLEHVLKRGYVSLRCTWEKGCPAELTPLHPFYRNDDRSRTEQAYASVFRRLFPHDEVPGVVGAHCSSQFAVSRARLRARPKKQYERIRDWLVETDLDDAVSSRVLEYMWHIIFRMHAVDCQDAGECFCQTFGLCNLTCDREKCRNRYWVPNSRTMPEGWPETGPGSNGWPERWWAD
ncbi:unnamed protein product [Periconia digitata]|uniref:Uncharacterized protein n=1 Tax=Periconia digitata TaxID=1303443 RepID=A0A9W4UBQ7_9PLEO|nr:unnamed protein product [Periconia digitata]